MSFPSFINRLANYAFRMTSGYFRRCLHWPISAQENVRWSWRPDRFDASEICQRNLFALTQVNKYLPINVSILEEWEISFPLRVKSCCGATEKNGNFGDFFPVHFMVFTLTFHSQFTRKIAINSDNDSMDINVQLFIYHYITSLSIQIHSNKSIQRNSSLSTYSWIFSKRESRSRNHAYVANKRNGFSVQCGLTGLCGGKVIGSDALALVIQQ